MLKQDKGFTVIEILIGIALFGFVMPAVIFAIVGLGSLNDRAADLTRANVLAEKKIEELRSKGYNSLDLETVSFTGEIDASLGAPRNAYYTVSSSENGIKDIELFISYTDVDTERQLTYKSRISELGVAQ